MASDSNCSAPKACAGVRFAALLHLILPILLQGILFAGQAMAQSASVSVGSASGAPESVVSLPVGFTAGATGISALQFDLIFPSSLTYVSNTAQPAADAAGKKVFGNAIAGGARIIVFGVNNAAIGSGDLAVVHLKIAAGVSGNVSVSIKGVVASDASGKPVSISGSAGNIAIVSSSAATAPAKTIS